MGRPDAHSEMAIEVRNESAPKTDEINIRAPKSNRGEIVTKKLAPLTGVLFAVLVLAAAIPDNSPSSNNPAKWTAFYHSHSNRVHELVLCYLWILAGITLIAFFHALKARMKGEMAPFTFTTGTFAGLAMAIGGGLYGTIPGTLIFGGARYMPSGMIMAWVTNVTFGVMLATMGLLLAASLFSLAITILRQHVLSAWMGYFAILAGIAGIVAVAWLPLIVVVLFTFVVGIALSRNPSSIAQ
jgi:hypothetical protein